MSEFVDIFGLAKKEPRELKNLHIDEVSLVDSPANKQSFLFFKSENPLTEVLIAEEFTDDEIQRLESICQPLQKASDEEANAISILVLGAGSDEPQVSVDKSDSIVIETDDDEANKVLSDALEVVGGLELDSQSAVRRLLKFNWQGKILWPSLSAHQNAVEDKPVNKNTGGLWPSISGRAIEKEEVVAKKTGLKWPSLQQHI